MISKQEFYNQFNAGQNQYTYFIMAIDASAIAFTTQKINDNGLSMSLIAAALALVCWGISFFSGMRFQQLKNEAILHEYQNMDIREKDFPGIEGDQNKIKESVQVLEKNVASIQEKMHLRYNLLNIFMIAGLILFIAWQVWEIVKRS